jgi:hypothetical protein
LESAPVLFPPIELPDANAQAHLSRFGVGAIFIASGPAGSPVVIGSGTDLAAELAAARKALPKDVAPPEIRWCVWCFDARTAQQIATLAIANGLRSKAKTGRALMCSLEEASSAIVAAAGRLHFRLTDHAAVVARIRATGQTLDARLEAAQRAGLLKTFNQAFKERRIAAQLPASGR